MSGLFGGGKDPNKAAMKQQKAQMERLNNLSVPELEEYMLQNPELVGLLNAENIDPSKLGEISLDPRLRENQMQALQSLQERSDEGLTATDKYSMEQLLGQVASQEKSNQAGIEADMARKGMDSSGAALMAKLQSGQSSANNARDKAMQMAAQGQQNRMGALQALGQQSGNMEQADFGRKAKVASAQDAISRANAMNRQNVAGANLAARQGIENQRANTANQQSQVSNQIKQQNFNNEFSKAGGQGNVANSMSNIAANSPNKPGGLQSALSGAATGAAFGAPGAAIGAGLGLLSSLEDGGVAGEYKPTQYAEDGNVMSRNSYPIQEQQKMTAQDHKEQEDKKHENFKKKYMKRVHDELLPEQKVAQKEVTGAEDGSLFLMDKMKKDIENQRLGIGNDKLSGEVATNDQAQEFLKKDEGMDIGKSVGLLSKLLAGGKSSNKRELNLKQNDVQAPQNVMNPVGPQNFANPFAQIPQALEDGGTMYASDGQGDIIDSGMESYAGDRVDAKVNDGEAVLNVPQQQRFMDLVRGKISVDELGDDDIIEGVPRDYRDSMHERIEEESEGSPESSDKMKGLEKLLEMLGE